MLVIRRVSARCGRHQVRSKASLALPIDDAAPLAEIPGPKALPLLGTVPKRLPGGELYAPSLEQTALIKYQKWGPIVREDVFPGYTMIDLYDPDDFAAVYRAEGKYPNRQPMKFFRRYQTERGLTVGFAHRQGEEWHEVRKHAQQILMRPKTVSAFVPAQGPIADELVTRLRNQRDSNGEVSDTLKDLYTWALESLGVLVFDARLGAMTSRPGDATETQRFIQAATDGFDAVHKLFYNFPFYLYFNTPTYKRFCKNMDFVLEVTKKHAEATVNRALRGEQRFVPPEHNLVLHMLAQDGSSHADALVHLTDFFYAGVHSVSNTLCFALYNLARNPHAQQRLQEEIDEQFPVGQQWSPDTLSKFSYLKAVIKESLRVSPTIGMNNRRLPEDIILKGYRIPAGSELILNHAVSGWLPENVDEPHRFMPERWLRGHGRQYHPFMLVPFGFGPRMCIGRRLAEQEISIALIKLLQSFTVEYHHEDIGQVTSLANKPDRAVRLRLLDRSR